MTLTEIAAAGPAPEPREYKGHGSVEVNGATLYYGDQGAGTPLVLVHGGLMSSAMWMPFVAELADGFRVITPDSRGHGRSTNPSGQLSYRQMADDVAGLITALDESRRGRCCSSATGTSRPSGPGCSSR